MRRIALLVLLSSHALGFARVTLCAPAAQEAEACLEAAAYTPVVDGGTSCEDCGMTDCSDLSACVAPTPVLAAFVRIELTASSLIQPAEPAMDRPIHIFRPPIRPPPKG